MSVTISTWQFKRGETGPTLMEDNMTLPDWTHEHVLRHLTGGVWASVPPDAEFVFNEHLAHLSYAHGGAFMAIWK